MLVTNNGFMKWWNDGGKHPLVGDIHSLRTWSHGHWNVVSFPMNSMVDDGILIFVCLPEGRWEFLWWMCIFWLYMDAYDEFLG